VSLFLLMSKFYSQKEHTNLKLLKGDFLNSSSWNPTYVLYYQSTMTHNKDPMIGYNSTKSLCLGED
jgi:hypothetical protein